MRSVKHTAKARNPRIATVSRGTCAEPRATRPARSSPRRRTRCRMNPRGARYCSRASGSPPRRGEPPRTAPAARCASRRRRLRLRREAAMARLGDEQVLGAEPREVCHRNPRAVERPGAARRTPPISIAHGLRERVLQLAELLGTAPGSPPAGAPPSAGSSASSSCFPACRATAEMWVAGGSTAQQRLPARPVTVTMRWPPARRPRGLRERPRTPSETQLRTQAARWSGSAPRP